MKRLRSLGESIIERLVQLAGILAIVFVVLILAFLLRDALPVLKTVSLGAMLGGDRWSPTAEPPKFGFLPMILGSLYVTVGALILAVPLGLACAVFISEVAPPAWREALKPAVELLAAVPSVIFGFLGLLLIGPWLQRVLDLPVGQFAALGSLLLAFMALPTIVSVSEDALRAVPRVLRHNSLALGATEWQTIRGVTFPAARSGLLAAVLLGMGRAIGETMTVLMVCGNAPIIPQGLGAFLGPVRTMTATIASEMGEVAVGSSHYSALFMIGLLLLLITLAVNLGAEALVRRTAVRAK